MLLDNRVITRMHVIPEAFSFATLVGLWPNTVLAKFKKYYRFYTYASILMMYSLVTLELIAMLYLNENVDEFIESLHVLLTVLNSCVKCANIVLRRNKYLELAAMFLAERCSPRNSEEKEMRNHYDWLSRMMTIGICALGELTGFMYAIKPLFFIREEYTLAIRVWLPYDVNSSLTFWPTFLHQAFAAHVVSACNVGNDMLAIGFMIQICLQLQLMSHRLKGLPGVVGTNYQLDRHEDEKNVVKECVLHHLHIIKVIKTFKLTFAPIILSQYCLSGITICLTIYELIVNKTNISALIIVAIYLTCMTVELGAYCWFGNEITLKSLQINDFIYEGNWAQLQPRTIKCLMIVMLRASSPIFVTYGPFITLSNAAYMGILKVSYSSYNVLQNIH